jgi:hypothetical protein
VFRRYDDASELRKKAHKKKERKTGTGGDEREIREILRIAESGSGQKTEDEKGCISRILELKKKKNGMKGE